MKRAIILSALLLVAGCASGSGSAPASDPRVTLPPGQTPTPAQSDQAADTAEPNASVEPTAPPAEPADFKPITLKGRGDKVAKFKVPADVPAIATVTHKGKSNFIVTSLASDGSDNDLVVNVIGNYKGTVLFDDNEHSVAFKVEADGAWTIVVKPLMDARKWNGTSILKGSGDDVVIMFPPSSGLATLDWTHKGSSNFIVDSFTGQDEELLINEIGNYKGEVLLPDGTALFTIESEGSWTATPG